MQDDGQTPGQRITALRPPRRRATFIAQAFSHDHLITRVSID